MFLGFDPNEELTVKSGFHDICCLDFKLYYLDLSLVSAPALWKCSDVKVLEFPFWFILRKCKYMYEY